MENLNNLQGLDQLFGKIAEILGVTLDTVQANGMDWIMEYGRYCFYKDLPSNIFWSFLLSAIIPAIIWLIVGLVTDFDDDILLSKPMGIIYIGIYVGSVITDIASSVLPYVMSPTFYSIEQALKLLN